MKRIKHIICLLAVALAGSGSLNAQGLGFYGRQASGIG